MKVIVYPPKDPDSIRALQKKVATVHAEAVLRYLNKLSCPKEQKIKLLNALIEKGTES